MLVENELKELAERGVRIFRFNSTEWTFQEFKDGLWHNVEMSEPLFGKILG